MRFAPLLTGLCLVVSSASAPADWPQFRGPGGQGHAEVSGLPIECGEAKNVGWKVPVPGRGWSSPVVLGEQIWLTTAIERPLDDAEKKKRLEGLPISSQLELVGELTLRAVALNLKSGKIEHDVELFKIDSADPIHSLNSYASPTPVLEPGRVYCHFGSMGTACVDTSTGQVVWKRQVPLKHNVGPGSSPVVYNDLLVLTCDGVDAQFVLALDKQTGQPRWKTDRPDLAGANGDLHKAFCTPLLIEAGGREQLVIPGAQWVVAYEPASGRPIWKVSYDKGFSNVPRPVFGHGMVFICTGFMDHQLWAIKVDETSRGDVSETHVAWKETRQVPDRPSPLLVGRALYTISGGGVASCFDALTGETHWRQRLGGNYSASPLYADGRIYCFSQEGKMTVIQPGSEFVKLAENDFDGRFMATPAVADGALLLRSDTHLYRVEEKR